MGEVAVLYLRLCHKLYTGRDKGKDSGKDEEFLNRKVDNQSTHGDGYQKEGFELFDDREVE